MDENREVNPAVELKNLKRSMFVSLGASCLTMLIAVGAIAAGLLLDVRMNSFPRFTLILLIGSAPFTLIGLFFAVRKFANRSAAVRDAKENNDAGTTHSQ